MSQFEWVVIVYIMLHQYTWQCVLVVFSISWQIRHYCHVNCVCAQLISETSQFKATKTSLMKRLCIRYKLYKLRCNGVRTHFFTNRVLDVWKSLSGSVMFSILGAFKRSVRTVDFSKFLKRNSN